eukprot:TRINITY_DN6386_c0_g1_i1.p1 TRINITY_DN6386_c0_g1~~TRINITY_DN6386_c0_g1_i1.p1  ORF type:complete len:242 (+),score=47.60 TRINITY_DN6386_c0_g1_i1:58-783(+)
MLKSALRGGIMNEMKFLTQMEAIALDKELMAQPGFAIETLMELAGLSCACSIYKEFEHRVKNILLVCGPGNNGGDCLVAGRHLHHFGYKPTICYPKTSSKPLFINLLKQCKDLHIPIISDIEEYTEEMDLLVDGVFGFSFKGALRAPFDSIVKSMTEVTCDVVSIDIPSGWDVEEGRPIDVEFVLEPNMLISLTTPKLCAKFLPEGCVHYLGGRFVPPAIVEKYELKLPSYPGCEQCIRIN